MSDADTTERINAITNLATGERLELDPETAPFFEGKVGPVFAFSGPPPVALGFDAESQTIFLPTSRSADGPRSSGGVSIAYVDELPAGASPCEDFARCLAALMFGER